MSKNMYLGWDITLNESIYSLLACWTMMEREFATSTKTAEREFFMIRRGGLITAGLIISCW